MDVSAESTESGGDVPNEKRENRTSQATVIPDIENNELDTVSSKEDSSVEILLEAKPQVSNMQDKNLENENSSNKEDTLLSSSLCNHSDLSDVNRAVEETITEPSVNNQEKTESHNSESSPDVSQQLTEESKDTESSIKSSKEMEQTSVVENVVVETQSSEDVTKPHELVAFLIGLPFFFIL